MRVRVEHNSAARHAADADSDIAYCQGPGPGSGDSDRRQSRERGGVSQNLPLHGLHRYISDAEKPLRLAVKLDRRTAKPVHDALHVQRAGKIGPAVGLYVVAVLQLLIPTRAAEPVSHRAHSAGEPHPLRADVDLVGLHVVLVGVLWEQQVPVPTGHGLRVQLVPGQLHAGVALHHDVDVVGGSSGPENHANTASLRSTALCIRAMTISASSLTSCPCAP